MRKRINQARENLLKQHKGYRSEEQIFIDVEQVRKVKRKAIQMKSKLSLRIVGIHYQQCLEELGLWDL